MPSSPLPFSLLTVINHLDDAARILACTTSAGLEGFFGDDPTSTGDMLYVVFEGSGQNLFSASRASASAPWEPATAVAEHDLDMDQHDPWLSPNGRAIVFTSRTPAGPQFHQAVR